MTVIWTPIERLLFITYVFILFIGGIGYFKRAREKEDRSERIILSGFAAYLILNSIGLIFLYLSRFYAEGTFNGIAFIGEFTEDRTPIFELLGIGHTIFDMGSVLLVLEIERVKPQTKHILTCSGLMFYIIAELSWWTGFRDIYLIWQGLLGIITIIIVLSLVKSSLKIQNISLFLLIGVLIINIGYELQIPEALETNRYPIELAFLTLLIGSLFYLVPAYFDVDKISRTNPNFYWSIFITVNIVVLLCNTYFFAITFGLTFLIGIFFAIMVLFAIIYIYTQTKKAFQGKSGITSSFKPLKEQTGQVDVVKILSRPKGLTEEEVSVSKEKKICLVCKGKVLRFNSYICECDTIYCQKCARALSDLENACWACGAPFDETKPVKKIEPEEETGVEIVEESRKKGKDMGK